MDFDFGIFVLLFYFLMFAVACWFGIKDILDDEK